MDLSIRLANMISSVRYESGVSQDALAKKMGVSKKTIQNWENGETAISLPRTIEWFDALGVPPYPHLMRLFHPLMNVTVNSTDEEIKDALHTYIDEMPDDICRKWLYLLFADHGSCPDGLLEMLTAYLHTPLSMRLNIASSVITNYEICKAHDLLVGEEHISPNYEVLTECYRLGKDAVMKKHNSYFTEVKK